MNLPFGKAISANELERLTASWGAEGPARFAVVADAVAGWEAYAAGDVPELTARIFAKDGGLDGKIHAREVAAKLPASSLLRPGFNVLQYKFKGDRSGPFDQRLKALCSDLEGTWARTCKALGRSPDRYILFTNLDLTENSTRIGLAEKEQLKSAILKGQDPKLAERVDIMDAAALASYLNSRRALLAGFFWDRGGAALELFRLSFFRQQSLSPDTRFVNRTKDLGGIKQHLESGGRVTLIRGARGTGKTRLALEALRPWWRNTLVVEEGSETPPSFLREIEHTEPCVLLVEEPEPEKLEAWVKQALGSSNVRLVMTMRASERQVSLGPWAADERFQEVPLEPLSQEARGDLVREVAPAADPTASSWLSAQTGDTLETLVQAARLGDRLRRGASRLRSVVMHELDLEARSRLSERLYKVLRRLSLLTRVNPSNHEEMSALANLSLADGPLSIEDTDLQDLKQAGFIVLGPSSLSVTPAILGDALFPQDLPSARTALRELPRRTIFRFLERAGRAECQELWDVALDPQEGLFRDLDSFHRLGAVCRTALDANPKKLLYLLEKRLDGLSRADLLELKGDARRAIVSTLERLLAIPETASKVVPLLARLAAAETETWGNRSEALLAAALRPIAPQYALGKSRAQQVSDLLASEDLETRVAISRALADALADPVRGSYLTEPRAAEPNAWFLMQQVEEQAELTRAYAHILLDLAHDNENAISGTVRGLALNALRPELLDADLIARAANLFLELLQGELAPTRADLKAWVSRAEKVADQETLKRLSETLADNSLRTRILNLLQLYPEESSTGGLKECVTAWLAEPEALSWSSLAYRANPGAPALLDEIGRQDPKGAHWPRLLTAFRQQNAPAWQFLGSYLRHSVKALSLLDDLEDLETGNLLIIISSLTPTAELVDRVCQLIASSPEIRNWFGGLLQLKLWKLGDDEAMKLLTALAGPADETAGAAVSAACHLFLQRLPANDERLRQLAVWLGKAGDIQDTPRAREWDRLAQQVANRDLELGFVIFEERLKTPERLLAWNPLAFGHSRSLLTHLLEKDAARVLRVAQASEASLGHYGCMVVNDLRRGLRLDHVASVLLEHAQTDEAAGLFVVNALDPRLGPGQDAFWRLVQELIRSYPLPSQVSRALLGSILMGPTARVGTEADYRAQALKWTQERLQEPALESPVREWLERLAAELSKQDLPDVLWEYDLPRADFARILEDRTSPDRRWAVERILRESSWEEARQFVTLEDLREVLPGLDLPHRKKKALERALATWEQNGR